MSSQPFSIRAGLRETGPLVYDDAPEGLRYGLREVFEELGYTNPKSQRQILCKALRVMPDLANWSVYPNVDDEVTQLVSTQPWFRFFDALERIGKFLLNEEVSDYQKKMNELFAEERVGYRFESGSIVRMGTVEFHGAVHGAVTALQDDRFAEPRRQFQRAYEFRNARPPDWANAIKEAVNSVEGVLQVIYERPGVALPSILSQDFPDNLPGGIKKLFQGLYSQGSGTVGARHAAVGGNEPTGPRAELAIHTAASLHAFAIAELDARTGHD